MNANPAEFLGKPKGWYGTPTEQPGLSPVQLNQPLNPTAKTSARCECGAKVWLVENQPGSCPACGRLLERSK